MTNKLPPATEFDLRLFYWTVKPRDEATRADLMRAIDAWRAADWKGREILDKQLVTAVERALACAPIDLPMAMAGVQELITARSSERSQARMEAELAALERARKDRLSSEGAAPTDESAGTGPSAPAPSAPELPLDPPHTRWDERADVNG